MKIIEHLAAKYDIEEYIILGANLPRMTALQMQRDTDILLFLEVESPNIPGILTGKLFEYLNSTSPIWAVGVSNKTISGKLIEDANAGIAFGKDVKLIQNRLQLFLTEKTIKPVDITHSKIKYFDRCTLAMKILDNFNIQNRELD